MIYIVSSKNLAVIKRALEKEEKQDWIEISIKMPDKRKLKSNDEVYFDYASFSQAELKKALTPLKKNGVYWGIIDPKGAARDPASFFFEGACDYIGPALIKEGLTKKRFAAAFSWAVEIDSGGEEIKATNGKAPETKKKSQKLPAVKFEGWKTIRTGAMGHFFFLFVSLSGKSNLRSLIGDIAFNVVMKRLRDVLQQGFWETDALLWMEAEDTYLFLVPPSAVNCKETIEAALKMILNTRLICMEKLDLLVPVEFTFALHYGQTIFHAPGKTGSVIAEPVNYIFHLGIKRAETGRLTISDDVPEEVLPDGLQDFFSPAGIFEGIPIRHSKRIIFK